MNSLADSALTLLTVVKAHNNIQRFYCENITLLFAAGRLIMYEYIICSQWKNAAGAAYEALASFGRNANKLK